jgi:hypothetical protein
MDGIFDSPFEPATNKQAWFDERAKRARTAERSDAGPKGERRSRE